MLDKWLKATLNKQAQELEGNPKEIWEKINTQLDQEGSGWKTPIRRRVWSRVAVISTVCIMLLALTITSVPQVKAFTQEMWKRILIKYEVVFDGNNFVVEELETPREGLSFRYQSELYDTIEEAVAATEISMILPDSIPEYETKRIYGDLRKKFKSINVFFEGVEGLTWMISKSNVIGAINAYEVDRKEIEGITIHIGKTYTIDFKEDNPFEIPEILETLDVIRWIDPYDQLVYKISGNISLDEMLQMAESIIHANQEVLDKK